MKPVTRTVEGVTAPFVPEIGAHHLRLARVPLDANLQVTPADLKSVPATAQPGETVTVEAVVRNTGLRPIIAGKAELVATPVSGTGESVIGTQAITNLGGGATVTVSYQLPRPAMADKQYSVRLTSSQPVSDADSDDNQAALGAEFSFETGPTLYSGAGAFFPIRVTQQGGIPLSGIVPAVLRLDGENGPVVGRADITFPVTPTTTVDAQAFVTADDIGAGRHSLVWQLNPYGTVGEQNLADNIDTTQATVAADLTTTADEIKFGAQPGATAPVSIWVQNTGVITSTATTMEILDGLPAVGQIALQAANRLATLAVPPIPPGAFVEVKGMLNLAGTPAATIGLKTIAVRMDPDNSLPEIDENEDLALAGDVLFNREEPPPTGGKIYLPLVVR